MSLAEVATLILTYAEKQAGVIPASEVDAVMARLSILADELARDIAASDVIVAAKDLALIRVEHQQHEVMVWLARHRQNAWDEACKTLRVLLSG